MKKGEGDFVFADEVLAKRIFDMRNIQDRATAEDSNVLVRLMDDLGSVPNKMPVFIPAPITGTMIKVDLETGKVTIQYDKKPYQKFY